jgi:hypothetical protein
MSGRIPTSTSVSESAVIEAPFSAVWHLIKLQDFSKFWSKLDKSEWVKGASEETDIVKWTFKDGTQQEVKQEEHSVRLPASLLRCASLTHPCSLSITTSPTASSRLSLSSRTPPSSQRFVHTQSHLESTRDRLS